MPRGGWVPSTTVRAFSLLTALLVLLGTACPMTDQEKDTTLPLFTSLSFDGVAPENSRVLLFHVDFRDSDGDLAAGTLAPLINGKTTGDEPASLRELMLANGLPLDAVSGTLEFVLEVQLSDDPASLPESGSTFDVGVLATDGAGHESNQPTVTLELSH